jgi:hypothetical protein
MPQRVERDEDMKKRLIAIAAALAVIAGGALAGTPASAASLNGSVKGHILSVGGSAVSGARVVVYRAGETVALKKATASKTGRYEMALKPGTYRLIAIDPKNRYASRPAATTFTVETGVADHVNTRLSAGSAITGKVSNSSGKRLGGVGVTAFGTNERGETLPAESATTNSQGEFTLRGLTAGSYVVRYSSIPGYATVFYGGTDTSITLGTGEKRTGTSVVLPRAGKITGRAYVNGIAAETDYGQVLVSLIRKSTDEVVTTIEVDPAFKLYDIPVGNYILRFSGGDGAPIAGTDLPVTVKAGKSITGLVAQLTTTGPAEVQISRTISPDPVTAGAEPFVVSLTAYGYANAAGAAVTLSYDGSVQQTGTLDLDNSAKFTVPSDFWVGKPGSNVPLTIDVAATTVTKASTTTIAPVIR